MKYIKLTRQQKSIKEMVDVYGHEIAKLLTINEFKEYIDFDKYEKAINKMIEKSDSFRIGFKEIDAELVQYIKPYEKIKVEKLEFETEEEKNKWLEKEIDEELSYDNLWAVKLFKYEDKQGFLFKIHHIIADGMAYKIGNDAVAKYYRDEDDTVELYSYLDAIESQEAYLSSNIAEKNENYWLNLYKENNEFNLFYPKVPKSNKAKRSVLEIPKELADKCKTFSAENGVFLMNTLFAAISIVYKNYTDKEKFYIGTALLNRNGKKEKNTVGMFAGVAPIYIDLEKNSDKITLLKNIKSQLLNAMKNQRFIYNDLLKSIKRKTDETIKLFDVMVSYQKFSGEENLYSSTENILAKKTSATLSINILERFEGDNLELEYDYLEEVFSIEDINWLHNHIIEALNNLLGDSEEVNKISCVSEIEINRIINEFNTLDEKKAVELTIIDVFEEVVKNNLNKHAVVFRDNKLTYNEFNNKVNKLAHHLRSIGIGKNDIVGISAEKNIKALISIMAILKAGACYVPIDFKWPEDRIKFIIEDTGIRYILSENINSIVDEKLFILTNSDFEMENEDNPIKINEVSDLAYIIYTSGTTGKPKGVEIEHVGVSNFKFVLERDFGVDENDNVLLFHSLTFDASVCEILSAFLLGGTLHIVTEEEIRDIKYIEEYANKNISVITLPPMYAVQMNLKNMKFVLTAGSVFNRDILKKYENIDYFINGYGPTETTVGASIHRFTKEDYDKNIHIGKPMCNKNIYILDKSGDLSGISIPGEICVTGVGLSRGYRNNKDLTDKSFIKNPFGEGRLYKTGDLGKWNPDGTLEFLGRIDKQVKIRGYRIELEEVVGTLRSIENIIDAAVIVKNIKNQDELCAYLVGEKQNIAWVKKELRKRIPQYMIPQNIMFIDKLPLTSHGKLDEVKLPEIQNDKLKVLISPRTEREEITLKIFEDILGVSNISVDESFFDLGGDSIKAIRMISSLRDMGYSVNVKEILELHTVEEIAKVLVDSGMNIEKFQSSLIGEVSLLPIQKLFIEKNLKYKNHFNQAISIEVNKNDFNLEVFEKSIGELVKYHDALRGTFVGSSLVIKEVEFKAYEIIHTNKENISEIHESINLENGPLMKIAIIENNNNYEIVIIIHHLIIDGISWRIILSDLEQVYKQIKNKENIKLPQKTASIDDWGKAIIDYSKSKELDKELEYWRGIVDKSKDTKSKYKKGDKTNNEKVVINKDKAQSLVLSASKKYGAQAESALMAVIIDSINKLNNDNTVSIHLEGHGREGSIGNTPLDRTVGWLTSSYPFIVKSEENIEGTLINIKEDIYNIPKKGIGFGILKYISEEELNDNSRVCFNYLGSIENNDFNSIFKINPDGNIGNLSNEENDMGYSIVIDIFEKNGDVNIRITYQTTIYSNEDIEFLKDNININIDKLIESYENDSSKVYTSSDFRLKRFDSKELYKINKYNSLKNIEGISLLTSMQEGILYHSINSKKGEYLLQNKFIFTKPLDIERFKDAVQNIVNNHESLRSRFLYKETERPIQVINKNDKATIIEEKRRGYNACEIEEYAKNDIKHGFNLEEDNLLKVRIIPDLDGTTTIIWTIHHLIIDGWCNAILFNDLINYYNNRDYNSEKELKVYEYKEWLFDRDYEGALNIWESYLEGIEDVSTVFSNTHTRKEVVDNEGVVHFIIDQNIHSEIDSLAGNLRVTTSTIMETAWAILLKLYNNTDDVVFGKVVSGRNIELKGIEKAVGLFVNTIPVRHKFDKDNTIESKILKAQENVLEMNKYEFCSIGDIQKKLNSRENLFETLFVFENYYKDENLFETLKDMGGEISDVKEQTSYKIMLSIFKEEAINITLTYDNHTFDSSDMNRVLQDYQNILKKIIQNKTNKVQDINWISDEDYELINNKFNDTEVRYNLENTLIDTFNNQVSETPNAIAVEFANEYITYSELNKRANTLARFLIEKGVKEEEGVILISKRSIEMIIAIYGIIKAGAYYIPVDPNAPEERLRYMIDDSNSKVILVQKENEKLKDIVSEEKIINLENIDLREYDSSNFTVNITPESIAYMIYTSGTTGQPKGVMVPYKGVMNRILWMQEKYPIGKEDTILQKTNYTFDVSVWEMFWWHFVGAKLVMLKPDGEKDVKEICDTIESKNITVIHFVPSMLNMFLTYIQENKEAKNKIKSLKDVFASGEALSLESVKQFNLLCENAKLNNLYGPTEASIDVTYFDCVNSDITKVPIGKPISNIKLYVVNNEKLCGIGVPGEICISGVGLAKEYKNKPDVTKEKFIQNPFGEGRLYKTGDLGKWLEDGNIEYLGRIDHQVKIRGYRIELGEIENVIRKIDNIVDTAVITQNINKENYICAYIVSNEESDISSIKSYMREYLPEYMIPTYIMKIESIPVTPNGKLDRKALPKAEVKSQEVYIEAKTEVEIAVVKAFESVLNIERVGINDSFFELGGDSIKAIRLVSKIRELGYELELEDLMTVATVKDIAKIAKKHEANIGYEQGQVVGESGLFIMQKNLYAMNIRNINHYNQGFVLEAKKGTWTLDNLKEIMRKIVIHHDIFRAKFNVDRQIINEFDEKMINVEMVELYNLSDTELKSEIEIINNIVQRGFDLKNGDLFKSVLFDTDDYQYLSLIGHHFILDGISWHIILQDIITLTISLENILPRKTASVIQWYDKQKLYSKSNNHKLEIPYWKDVIEEIKVLEILKKDSRYNIQNSEYEVITKKLSKEDTKSLTLESNEAFTTQTNDLLIASLSMAIKDVFSKDKVAIMLEGHGREKLETHIDIDRTVGWFTSIYPVLIKNNSDIKNTIISAKEALRKIPNKGIGFGIEKYIGDGFDELKNIEICFNYLGKMDIKLSEDIKISEMPLGDLSSKENHYGYPIVINVLERDEQLEIYLVYDNNYLVKAEAEIFIGRIKDNLISIINECKSLDEVVVTASDLGNTEIELDELDELMDLFN